MGWAGMPGLNSTAAASALEHQGNQGSNNAAAHDQDGDAGGHHGPEDPLDTGAERLLQLANPGVDRIEPGIDNIEPGVGLALRLGKPGIGLALRLGKALVRLGC